MDERVREEEEEALMSGSERESSMDIELYRKRSANEMDYLQESVALSMQKRGKQRVE